MEGGGQLTPVADNVPGRDRAALSDPEEAKGPGARHLCSALWRISRSIRLLSVAPGCSTITPELSSHLLTVRCDEEALFTPVIHWDELT